MISFLHNFQPQAIFFSAGSFNIYWYGLLIVTGILAALAIVFRLAKYYDIPSDTIFDLSFWLIIGGIAGARLYNIVLEFPYYQNHPWQILQIWKGGLALHGGIFAGLIIIFFFVKKKEINFWRLAALAVPGLAIAQAIGRWGNYFNQELFGSPTDLPWGIPIDLANRPVQYITDTYFHPTFLYESLGCLLIGVILIIINARTIKKQRLSRHFFVWSTALYMILYSILRFSLEFVRSDITPYFLGLRWPQFISLLIITSSIILLISNSHARFFKDQKKE